MDSVRIGIIDDHAIVRAGIRMLIEHEPGIEVVYESATASEALTAAHDCRADIILLDIQLKTESGLDYVPKLLREFAPAKVLVLTAADEVETHLMAIEAGASGVVMKEQAPDVLPKAIRAVYCGEPWMGRALSVAALAKLSRRRAADEKMDPQRAKIASLTPREREVICVVARGFNGPRIAQALNISEATVRHHITSILSKLEVSSKLELAVYAFRHDLTRNGIPCHFDSV
jgi:DNA-binding NarL/FixJ family response regulator